MFYQFSVTAANCVANNDLLELSANQPMTFIKSSPKPRILSFIGLSGSTAAGDTMIEFRVAGKTQGAMFNSSTGLHDNNELYPCNVVIPANMELELICTDAADTNAVYVSLIIS